MRKIIFSLIFVYVIGVLPSFAIEIEKGAEFFANYVKKTNAYSKDLLNMYSKDVVIKRAYIKNDGSKQIYNINPSDYKKKLRYYSPFAKLIGYKNSFYELEYKKEGDKVRVTGYRNPSTSDDKVLYPISFLIGKNQNGDLKILEDYTETRNKIAK